MATDESLSGRLWAQYGGSEAVRIDIRKPVTSEHLHERSEIWSMDIDPMQRRILRKQYWPLEVRKIGANRDVVLDSSHDPLLDWMYDNNL